MIRLVRCGVRVQRVNMDGGWYVLAPHHTSPLFSMARVQRMARRLGRSVNVAGGCATAYYWCGTWEDDQSDQDAISADEVRVSVLCGCGWGLLSVLGLVIPRWCPVCGRGLDGEVCP